VEQGRAGVVPHRDHRRGAPPGRRQTGKPLVDVILDQAGAKGTGAGPCRPPSTWACRSPASPRPSSPARCRRTPSSAPSPAPARPDERGRVHRTDADAFIEQVRLALYASKIVAYSQGFDEIRAGAAEYGWTIDLGAISKIWRGGCIIRAQFLNRIADAYAEPDLPVLLTAPYFVEALARAQDAWRRIVVPPRIRHPRARVLLVAAYYDGLRARRLPAALIQGQRDFFGAHTYKRIDKPAPSTRCGRATAPRSRPKTPTDRHRRVSSGALRLAALARRPGEEPTGRRASAQLPVDA
jgi:6-phosphogluconate dehydrogenase